ncbi:MAG: serine/threonine protein kinase [Planctomycetes bacterium]|nr:serine/threonine protein kinase [Planctomycetota bacterium]
MTMTNAADLAAVLRKLQLLTPEQLAKVDAALHKRPLSAAALAKELLKQQWLTQFQVDCLLQGQGADLVLGEYLLLDELGAGGMGRVLKARHRRMDRIVALKLIKRERLASPDAVERFQREIRVAAQLDHPNLVRAHDASQVGETHFLVMEYAAGIDAHRLVRDGGPLPASVAAEYIRQAAAGLQHAAERGLVHRDIKPSNLQVTDNRTTIKILDLGLARSRATPDQATGTAARELTQTCAVLGTPDYMSPEQIDDPRRADIRSDIYSLGCTFYFFLTGRAPFADLPWEEKLVSHRKAEPVPVEQLRPEISTALGAVVRKMMAKRPEERYASPADLMAALAPFCLSASPSLPPTAHWSGTQSPAGTTARAATPRGDHGPAAGPVGSAGSSRQETNSPYDKPTVVVSGAGSPTTGAVRPYPKFPWGWLVLSNLLVVAAVVGYLFFKSDGSANGSGAGGSTSSSSGTANEKIVLEEDFRTTYGKASVPAGWEGDAFRVVKVEDETCLEVSQITLNPRKDMVEQRKPRFITLPALKLAGNFTISGVFHAESRNRRPRARSGFDQSLTIRLENRDTNEALVVVMFDSGAVTIGDDARDAAPNFNSELPTQFQVIRKGTELTVRLNQEVVASKNLGVATEFKTLKLGLTPGGKDGMGPSPGSCRLYKIKVSTPK